MSRQRVLNLDLIRRRRPVDDIFIPTKLKPVLHLGYCDIRGLAYMPDDRHHASRFGFAFGSIDLANLLG